MDATRFVGYGTNTALCLTIDMIHAILTCLCSYRATSSILCLPYNANAAELIDYCVLYNNRLNCKALPRLRNLPLWLFFTPLLSCNVSVKAYQMMIIITTDTCMFTIQIHNHFINHEIDSLIK